MGNLKSQPPILSEKKTLTKDQIELIKRTICKDATDDELKLFLSVCEKKKLDPFTNQIYAVKRWNSELKRFVMSFQTSIDGFRLIAERSGHYAGQLGPFWCDDEGNWTDVWLSDSPPIAAKVAVLRNDFKEPLWAVAKFKSFVQRKKDGTANRFWTLMPEHQIAKIAEAQAIRRSFPHELSGLYIEDEIAPAYVISDENKSGELSPVKEVYTATTSQKKMLISILNKKGIEDIGIMSEISTRLKDDGIICDEDKISQQIDLIYKGEKS